MVKSLNLLDNSPRNLMFSLQHKRSPSDGFGEWKVRNNDYAVEEILRERREARESGKFKGRKLFDDDTDQEEEDTAEIGFTGWDVDMDTDMDGDVRPIFYYDSDDEKDNISENNSFSSSSSYVCDDCMEKEIVAVEGDNKEVSDDVQGKTKEEEKESVITAGHVTSHSLGAGRSGKGCVVIGLTVCVIGVISMWRFSGYGDRHNEVRFLVPT
ncbi:hypothetical protein M5689_017495 [Euphorbia peplus]|nr:hypothetical protein M5689_017495 [Euphorbia peplus]